MIRVIINIHSYGLGLKVAALATVEITDDGTGTPSRRNYNIRALSKTGKCIRTARIENWPRKSKPPLALLSAALQEMGYHKLT